jgi:hypothetical protein
MLYFYFYFQLCNKIDFIKKKLKYMKYYINTLVYTKHIDKNIDKNIDNC